MTDEGEYDADTDVRSLLEGVERYRSLFTHNPHAVFSLDLQGNYRDANPACERLGGFSVAELKDMHFRDVICPERHEAALAAFDTVLDGTPTTFETPIRHKDGRTLEVRLVVVPVYVEGDLVGVHGVAEDVSEQKRAAAALEQARLEAEAASDAKSLLLANMSHELRTPLTTMLATAELLEDLDLDPVQLRLVSALQRSGARLRRLIDDILDFSRIEAGTMHLRSEPFHLPTVVDDIVGVVGQAAEAKGLRLDVALDPGIPYRLIGDPVRVSQVLTNLLDNAVKFTERGSVSLTASLVERGPGIARVEVKVSDTGVGIPDELREILFRPFTQGDPSATRRHDGAGLGLAISRQLVDLMGGSITLDPGHDSGTTIRVSVLFPVAPSPRRREP